MEKERRPVRSVYFGPTLRMVDALARKQMRSRSQMVRLLVRDAYARDRQPGLPGFQGGAVGKETE